MEEIKRTEISELGEFGLIELIAEKFDFKVNPTTNLGIGDDAAIINTDQNHQTVISTDLLIEGVHFDLTYAPLQHVGYKAVAVNVSDIAAMNAIPQQITVSIAISNRFSVEAIDMLYTGIRMACKDYKVDLVGGDTTSSKGGLVISVTAVGSAEEKYITKRSGAWPNDILCVTGDLGAAYLGHQVLEREKQVFMENPEMQPELDKHEYIVQRQLKAEARMDIIHELRDLNVIPTSMIDISDGLASEILHLCKASKLSAKVFEDKIPVHQITFDSAVLFNLSPITCALNGGEDYELLFTISTDDYSKIEGHDDIQVIGYMEKEGQPHIETKSGQIVPLQAQGWKHF